MDRREIARRRMGNQRLWRVAREAPGEVVRRFGAMQAQEFAYAQWSVAQRAEGVDAAAMARAFADGVILRTHVMRPTWHFVHADDIRLTLQVTAPRVHALNAHYYRKLGLGDEQFEQAEALLRDALKDAHRTRKEIAALFAEHAIEASGLRMGYLLMHAELEGVICSGQLKGKQQTYALLDERAGPDLVPAPAREEALAELTRRYIGTRGPVTVKDYAVWSSLTVAEARNGFEMVRAEFERAEVEGRTYWFAAGDVPEPPASPVVDLVQIYDEYIMSYSDSRGTALSPGEAPAFYHAILLDGHLIGHWRHALARTAATLEIQRYRPFDAAETLALEDAAERYGRYLGLPVRLRLSGGSR